MSKHRETAQERIARMQRERQQAEKEAKESKSTQTAELVGQLTHESDGEPDFAELAKKLEERTKDTSK